MIFRIVVSNNLIRGLGFFSFNQLSVLFYFQTAIWTVIDIESTAIDLFSYQNVLND